MPSEDSKPSLKRVSDDEEEDDKVSLGSILKQKNGNQSANFKKGEPSNGGGVNSLEKKPIRKLKREVKDEEGVNDDDDDDLPIGKRASFASNDKAKVKKETKAEDEDDDVPIGKKVTNAKNDKAKAKKEAKMEDEDDDVPIGKKVTSAKNDKVMNKKKVKEEPVKKATVKPVENGTKKRVRKVYDLPGQKRDPPEERDPLRIFYESLYEQIPNSEMAQFWMMESGLLSKEMAEKVFGKKAKRGSPAKSAASANGRSMVSTAVRKNILPPSPVSSNKKKTEVKVSAKPVKKRKDLSDNDSDDDFVIAKIPKRQRAA